MLFGALLATPKNTLITTLITTPKRISVRLYFVHRYILQKCNFKEALFLLALQLNSEVNFDLLKKKLDEMERVTGIEPASAAWEAAVLPLNYTRNRSVQILLYHLNFELYCTKILKYEQTQSVLRIV